MPLSIEQKQLKKRIYQALRDKALEPDDEFYVEIYKMAGCVDPIDQLREHIEFTDFESVQFFSGFRGSGKSTELLRLKRDLEEAGYFVVYADALKYINPADEIDITDLLIVLAGAFSDAIEENPNVKIDLQGESYWTRIKNYLVNTNLDITEITPKAGVGSKDTGGAELALKLALQTTPSFRNKLQQHLVNRIGALKEEVDAFFEDAVKSIKRALSDETQIVFIFDSLEQIRGSLFNQDEVIKSVERIFSQYHRLLEMPYVHAIYTVPPWLKFVMKNHPKRIEFLPSVKQWDKGEMRKQYQNGKNKFRELIVKRFGEDGFRFFFGADWKEEPKKADRIIDLSGGDFRALLSLLRETVLHAESFPVGDKEIEYAIASVRSTFLPIAKEDALVLAEIEATHSSSINDENLGRFARLLDSRLILYFRNGEEWYDIHPLVRGEVQRIIKLIEMGRF